MPNDVRLQEGHPVDENLRPIKVGGKSTAIETAQHGNGARVNGNLEVTGDITGNIKDMVLPDVTIDPLNTNNIVSTANFTLDAGGHIVLDATDAGATGGIFFKGTTNAGADSTFAVLNAHHNTTNLILYELEGASTDDYLVIKVAEHGATTIETVDNTAASGHLTLDPDGDLIVSAAGEIQFGTSTAGFTAQTGTDAVSIDWGEGNKYHLLLENSSTVTFATNPSKPCNLLLKVAQGDGGSNTITWAVTSGTIYWAGGGVLNTDEPTLTTTDDKTDILTFYFDGTNYFGVASLDFDTT